VQELSDAPDIARCVELFLQLRSAAATSPLAGTLNVRNKCAVPVAILLEPVETRIRQSATERFPHEVLLSAAYSVLYVYRDDVGLPPSAFRGDGARIVAREPSYGVVPARAAVIIPVTSTFKLAPGSYGASLLVPIVASTEVPSTRTTLDLSRTTEALKTTGGTGVRLRPEVVRVSTATTFTIQGKTTERNE